MNRQQLQDAYINTVIDNMDHKDMWALLFDFMDADFDKYSEAQLIEEVEQYYPELLEGWLYKLGGREWTVEALSTICPDRSPSMPIMSAWTKPQTPTSPP